MFALLGNRFGIPGIASVVALVFAMSGGAWAAKDYLGGADASAKKNNRKGKGKKKRGNKGKRGPRGKRGARGPAGPMGLQGPIGPAGPNGRDGKDGNDGSNGIPGQSVVATEFDPGEEEEACPAGEGGSKFVVGVNPPTYACNGKIGEDGEEGKEGSPWTAGGTLPKGETETGTWGFVVGKKVIKISIFEFGIGIAPISFTIPLKNALPEGNIEINAPGYEGGPADNCPGKASQPEAAEGFLCVYTLNNAGEAQLGEVSEIASSPGGVVLKFLALVEGQNTFGTWAVTASE